MDTTLFVHGALNLTAVAAIAVLFCNQTKFIVKALLDRASPTSMWNTEKDKVIQSYVIAVSTLFVCLGLAATGNFGNFQQILAGLAEGFTSGVGAIAGYGSLTYNTPSSSSSPGK